jgi:hypothetical protein
MLSVNPSSTHVTVDKGLKSIGPTVVHFDAALFFSSYLK